MTVVYTAISGRVDNILSLELDREEIKKIEKKISETKKLGTFSFFIATPAPSPPTPLFFLHLSRVDFKDSSVAGVCKILPPIIVAQCYRLLKNGLMYLL